MLKEPNSYLFFHLEVKLPLKLCLLNQINCVNKGKMTIFVSLLPIFPFNFVEWDTASFLR